MFGTLTTEAAVASGDADQQAKVQAMMDVAAEFGVGTDTIRVVIVRIRADHTNYCGSLKKESRSPNSGRM